MLKTSHLRAIELYAKKNNLKLALSVPPTIYFKDAKGKEVTRNLMNLMNEYKRDKKEKATDKTQS